MCPLSGGEQSVQAQQGQESYVDGTHFRAVQPAGELSQPGLRIDHCQLLDQHSGLRAVDFDLGAKCCLTASS